MEITVAVISTVIAALSVLFAILTYSRGKTKDSKEVTIKLTKMEADILYIRQSIDKNEDWKNSIEKRVRNLEIKKRK